MSCDQTRWGFMRRSVAPITVLCLVIIGSIEAFGVRYTLMVDPQDAPCIPGKHLFLVDKLDTAPERGGIFAVKAESISPLLAGAHPATNVIRPFYEDGRNLIKVMDGLPGDKVVIEKDRVTVNGEENTTGGLLLTGTLLLDATTFESEYELSEDEYFMAGRTDNSFDSRYWGPIKARQILGRAYPIM